ncbi:hypothetical protein WEH80_12640 [Actinomycetes bacterium KLBMP 9759]
MARHDCQVPNTPKKKWRCPTCKRVWVWRPGDPTGLTVAWHGRDNVRNGDGSKSTATFWGWLCS